MHFSWTQASVHGRSLLTQRHVSRSYFFGHGQSISSQTSPGAGFILFYLNNSQPFPIGVCISGFATKHFLQIWDWLAALLEWSCKLSKEGGMNLACSLSTTYIWVGFILLMSIDIANKSLQNFKLLIWYVWVVSFSKNLFMYFWFFNITL